MPSEPKIMDNPPVVADHSAEVTSTIRGRDNHNVVPSAAAVSLLMGLVR